MRMNIKKKSTSYSSANPRTLKIANKFRLKKTKLNFSTIKCKAAW